MEETHSDEQILAAEPYPRRRRDRAGVEGGRPLHPHHLAPPRAAHDATARWLERIGLPYDELYCSDDKVSHCRAIGIDLLIDDSPVNLEAAVDAGLRVATLEHPWNRDICEEEDIVCAPDWPSLARALEPLLQGAPR